MQKPRSPRFATTEARSDSLPPSAHPSQAQKDAAGDEALPKARPSCSTFSIRLPQPVPSTLRFHTLSTCRLQGRSCSYLLETAKIPWQGSSGRHKHSAVTRQIHPRRRQLHPPTSPAVKAFVSTLKMATAEMQKSGWQRWEEKICKGLMLLKHSGTPISSQPWSDISAHPTDLNSQGGEPRPGLHGSAQQSVTLSSAERDLQNKNAHDSLPG